MALSMTTATVHGLIATDAYHRVEHVVIASKSQIEFTVMSYASAGNPMAFGAKTMRCGYDMDGENPVRQAYLHLKTLPEFANAVDC
jgi:hypothetical protein